VWCWLGRGDCRSKMSACSLGLVSRIVWIQSSCVVIDFAVGVDSWVESEAYHAETVAKSVVGSILGVLTMSASGSVFLHSGHMR
jgi:hypothetical protein